MATVDFEIWLNHFEHHARHPRRLPSGMASRLTPEERQRIASSIATFQLGEQSEGQTLLRAAERFARTRGTPALVRIVELLVREEKSHAALILAYMRENQISSKRSDWTDRVFRGVRRLAGLELYLNVLISAELIGVVYYRALEAATTCPRLSVLCRALVADELAHIGFESQLLLALREDRPPATRVLMRLAHRGFYAGTAGVVWWTHRTLLRRSGYSALGFLRVCFSQYAFHLEPLSAKPATAPLPAASLSPATNALRRTSH